MLHLKKFLKLRKTLKLPFFVDFPHLLHLSFFLSQISLESFIHNFSTSNQHPLWKRRIHSKVHTVWVAKRTATSTSTDDKKCSRWARETYEWAYAWMAGCTHRRAETSQCVHTHPYSLCACRHTNAYLPGLPSRVVVYRVWCAWILGRCINETYRERFN